MTTEHAAAVKPLRHYFTLLAALLILLAISVGSALLPLGPFNVTINLAVSGLMTYLVMASFMHETAARRLTWLTAVTGFIWLAILIGLALADYLSRSPVPAPWH